MTLDDLRTLTPVEIDYIIDNIYKLLKEKVNDKTKNDENFNKRPYCCPHCKSILFIKYGFNKGKQKYYCKDCKKIFSSTTDTPYNHSFCNYLIWKKFIHCEILGLSLNEEKLEIRKSKTTCFNMRHKLYKAIEDITINIKLQGRIEVDSTYESINMKGTKPQNMPRLSKKRGYTSAYSGISHHKVCIVTAIDEKDNMLFRISGLGEESIDKYLLYRNFFIEGSTIISDSKSAIKNFAEAITCKSEQIPSIANKKRYATDNGNTISNVNELHTELSNLITRKHGVSIRHLQSYLNWIVFVKKLKYTIKQESMDTYTYMNTMKQTKTLTKREICKLPIPIDLYEAYGEYRYGIFA